MKESDFEVDHRYNGYNIYKHIENGKRREEIIEARRTGKMSHADFLSEQKKMRNKKYLQFLFSEKEYRAAIDSLKDPQG